MSQAFRTHRTTPAVVTFYHDVEQNLDSDADPKCCRQIVKEFLDLERQYGVQTTYNIVGKLFTEQPDLIDWITRAGHEVAFHSYTHRPDWSPYHYADQIDRCRNASESICGYRSPRSEIDHAAVQHLWEKGFLWNAEGDLRHEPYFIYKGLVRLPIATDDWPLHRSEVTVEEYLHRFAKLLRRRPYVALGFHDSATSFAPPERLKVWEQLLQMASRARTPTVTFSEAADLFRRSAVARFYTRTANDWNRNTRPLYRTRRFRELIVAEADRLQAPVVADLGSGGGVLSSALTGRANTIYCVDNAPGMVAEVDDSGGIERRLAEVTDSELPDHSVDFVLCARIVEYLFWPEHLADEIKRIGKIGAMYFVTFPASSGTPPPNEGSPPDRIRRYFTPDDIRRWAAAIGPGRLIGIQYESPEPSDAETERRYRRLEAHPPPDARPTNWVYIGTVERNTGRHPRRPTLPISAAGFRFPGERSDQVTALLRPLVGWLPAPVRGWLSRLKVRVR